MSNNQKIAVFIGGSSGLGLETSKLFSEKGTQVIIGSRSSKNSIDVSNEESIINFFNNVRSIDYLIITSSAKFADVDIRETDINDLKDFVDIKLWGALRAIKYALPKMNKGASIILISGAMSRKGRKGAHAKSIANGALESLTRSLAVDLGPDIRINCISPAIFDSKGIMDEEKKEKIKSMYPLKYIGNSKDVSELIYAVANNKFMTGSVIDIDGGWTAV